MYLVIGCIYIFFWGGREGNGFPDAGRGNFFLLMFRFRKAGSSKLSAARLWMRTDRRLIPGRCDRRQAAGAGRRLLGTSGFSKALCGVSPNPGAGQKAKNFQLFFIVTSEGKSFAARLALDAFPYSAGARHASLYPARRTAKPSERLASQAPAGQGV